MVDILVVGAHPDDAEMSMGGSILLFKEKGFKVGVVDLTNGEPTPFGSVKKRLRERDGAGKLLGLDERITLDLPNRQVEANLEARRKLAEVIRKLRPTVIFGHWRVDAHPDHMAASQIIQDARFTAKLTKTDMKGEPHFPSKLYYHQANHLRVVIKPAFILDITKQLDRKLKACACYNSQFHTKERKAYLKSRLTEMAAYNGGLIGCRYGEAFYCDEVVGLSDLHNLVEFSSGGNAKQRMADIEAWKRSTR
jgi:bacillithiol biosynthesis deacetylase BshB1